MNAPRPTSSSGSLPAALTPGMRVVIRYLVSPGGSATDALGVLLSRDEHCCTVRTRRGPVTIGLSTIVAAKQVPPSPERRRPRRPGSADGSSTDGG